MRSFRLLSFFIVLLSLTDFVLSMPTLESREPARKAVAKRPAARKAKPAAAVKKPAVKKTAAKKPAAKKPATKKPAAKKAPTAKTTTAKKATAAKKPTAKKATTAKTPAKKPTTAKKPATAKKPVNNAGKKPAAGAKKPVNGTKAAKKPAVKKPANSTAAACPLPKQGAAAKPAAKKTAAKKARELLDSFVDLFRRDTFEFVGFHGTNGENGDIYMQAAKTKGTIVVPFSFNGNDGELGGGLYVTDDFTTAQSFAGSSAANRKNLAQKKGCPLAPTDPAGKGVVCKVEAKSSSTFRSSVPKIWIPPNEIARPIPGLGNDPTVLAKQVARIKAAGASAVNTIRFSVLKANDPKNPRIGNQFMLPPGAFGNFIIRQCVPITAGKPGGTKEFPAFNYRNQDFDWNIAGDPFGEVDPNEEGDITDAKKGRDPVPRKRWWN